MSKKYSWGIVLLACALAVGLLLGPAPVAKAAPVPDESDNFVLIGQVDQATGPGTVGAGYSKIAPWPDTQFQTFNTGCYENDVNAGTVGCFRVVDVSDPINPVRIATVEVFDRKKSPRPPPPNDPYWAAHPEVDVWTNDAFNDLEFSTSCGDWAVNAQGKHTGPGWHDTKANPTCWDKGWITRTHFTAGVSGDFKTPDTLVEGDGCGKVEGGGSTIYWVNSQRLRNAPAKRLGYTGVAFYDLKNPSHPRFLGRINMEVDRDPDGTYHNAGGVHHGAFDGRYAYIGAEESGFEGAHMVIVDAIDPKNPVIVGRYWIPGQKDGEEAIHNDASYHLNPVTGVMEQFGWIDHSGFSPITRDPATDLLYKSKTFHWIEVKPIDGKVIAFISWHQAGLVIVDVTDRSNPTLLSIFDYLTPNFQRADTLPGASDDYARCQIQNQTRDVACGNSHSGKVLPGTNIFWSADEYFVLPYGHLRVFDVSDLTHPVLLSHLVLPETTDPDVTYAKRTASTHLGSSYGNVLFLAWYGLGVKAINLADPTDPQLVGTYSYTINDGEGGQATYDTIFDPYGNICVTDSNDGVRILRYTGPGAMNE